jgi:hypothetical protein
MVGTRSERLGPIRALLVADQFRGRAVLVEDADDDTRENAAERVADDAANRAGRLCRGDCRRENGSNQNGARDDRANG